MPQATATPSAPAARPRQGAPELRVELLSGDTYVLADQTPDRFTMVVFFRGLHCPVCQAQLRELSRRLDELAERGIAVIAVSGETRTRTQRLKDDWKLDRLPLAYGLSEERMRAWGLFVSRAINDAEPDLFNEPSVFLIAPEGSVYYEAILSMPVGRPRLDDLLGAIDYWTANDYPARGEA